MKLDPGIHIAMHSVLSLKPGVTVVRIAAVVAPGVLPPLPVVVDTLELVDKEAQVVVAQRL